jgi:chemotaxis protein methyltransferase CheR
MNSQGENQHQIEEAKNIENIEIALLLEAINMRYGYDFRNYSRVHVKRRALTRLAKSGLSSLAEMQHAILTDESFFHNLLLDLSLNVTEMFRDAKFFLAVREIVIPLLATYPYLKIWHAGCATGEEVFSMAIILKEEGLLNRSTIYATDFNQVVLKKAAEGIFPVKNLKLYSENYLKSGGKSSLSDHFLIRYNSALVSKELKKNIVFSDHNLVTDGVFGEMNLIVCRNVLIYFNRELQNRVTNLFSESLLPGGILCLGSKETLTYTDCSEQYIQLHKQNIFKRSYV